MTEEEIVLKIEYYRKMYFNWEITAHEYISKIFELICSIPDSEN